MTPKIVDLKGQRFGKLVVVEFVGTGENRKRARWKCKCECGNISIVNSDNLRAGKVIGCGKCRSKIGNQYGKYDLKTHDSAFKIFYRTIKLGAESRNLPFELSMDDVKIISSKSCFYCGCSPYYRVKVRNKFGTDYVYNGIDRVDNTVGYIIENVVPCCKRCNQAKMNLSLEDFKNLVINIFFNWASKV